MDGGDIAAGASQVLLIGRVEHGDIVVQHGKVFLLEDLSVFAQNLVAVGVILAVLGHLVDEKQGEGLDALVVESFLLLKVGEDGLPDLDAPHVLFGHVAADLAHGNHFAVGEGQSSPEGINLRNGISLVLLQLL